MRLQWDEARALSMEALGKLGFTEEEGGIVTDHLMDATARGLSYAGLTRILVIADRVRAFGNDRQPERVIHQTPISRLIDAGGNLGYISAHRATRSVIEIAGVHGAGIIGVKNCYATGNLSYFAEMATRRDMVALIAGNSVKALAPYGTSQAILGTNPIAIGLPGKADPVIWDASSSMVSHSWIRVLQSLGQPLPPGVAMDRGGRPTTDPSEALAGAMIPWGGHRGSGLAIAIQLLGMLCDTAPVLEAMAGWGFFALVFRVDTLMDPEHYKDRVTEFTDIVRSAQPSGEAAPRVPFERSAMERRQRTGQPIELPDAVYEALRTLSPLAK
jgi:delta1-piperideine-2-carboxylate reductase